MANPLRDMSVIMQGLVAAAIAVVLVLVGIYLPFSPVAQEKDQVDKAVQQRAQLTHARHSQTVDAVVTCLRQRQLCCHPAGVDRLGAVRPRAVHHRVRDGHTHRRRELAAS